MPKPTFQHSMNPKSLLLVRLRLALYLGKDAMHLGAEAL